MKKKLAALLLLVFSLSVGLVGCGSKTVDPAKDAEPVATEDGSWERVQKAGKITVGLDDSYKPMGFRDETTGEIVGFDIDMAKAIGEKLEIEFEFVPADWNAIVTSLLSGKFDCIISGMNMWPERVEQADFVAYGVASQNIVMKADNPMIKDVTGVDFFTDKKLGSQLGSTGAKVVTEMGYEMDKNLFLYKAFPDCTLDLDNGRLDAMIMDSFAAEDLVKEGKYVIVGDAIGGDTSSAKIGIAFNPKDKELQAKIQGAVDELIADGTLSELSKKWIGSDITEGLK